VGLGFDAAAEVFFRLRVGKYCRQTPGFLKTTSAICQINAGFFLTACIFATWKE
jgi:hypothetical protein